MRSPTFLIESWRVHVLHSMLCSNLQAPQVIKTPSAYIRTALDNKISRISTITSIYWHYQYGNPYIIVFPYEMAQAKKNSSVSPVPGPHGQIFYRYKLLYINKLINIKNIAN